MNNLPKYNLYTYYAQFMHRVQAQVMSQCLAVILNAVSNTNYFGISQVCSNICIDHYDYQLLG